MTTTITFLGAAGTVTGSKYLVETKDGGGRDIKILVDAGMFQGDRSWREKNWEDPDRELLKEIDVCLLTHAHIDHTGILPRYYRLGLDCPVYCTKATQALSQLLLMDSAYLQEEEASFRQKTGKSRHSPPLPLYTKNDAEGALKLLKSVNFGQSVTLFHGITARWSHMGHILGAASIELRLGDKLITFSGDVGRYDVPILRNPEPVSFGDLLLLESTYGNREHTKLDLGMGLSHVVNETYKKGGVLLIPSFAVGRTQSLLYYLRELKEKKLIPDIPVIIDSPMARDATSLYVAHSSDYDEQALGVLKQNKQPFLMTKIYFVKDREESKKLNTISEPMVIISASGMLSGGRVLHHLKQRISSPLNTILFVGFQPHGGRGAWIQGGAKSLRIFGEDVPIRARIEELSGLSAHGDKNELLRWCRESSGKPTKVAVVHGEPDSAREFSGTLKHEFGWDAFVAGYGEKREV